MIRLNFLPSFLQDAGRNLDLEAKHVRVSNPRLDSWCVPCFCGSKTGVVVRKVQMRSSLLAARFNHVHAYYLLFYGECECGQAFFDCLSLSLEEMQPEPSPGRY